MAVVVETITEGIIEKGRARKRGNDYSKKINDHLFEIYFYNALLCEVDTKLKKIEIFSNYNSVTTVSRVNNYIMKFNGHNYLIVDSSTFNTQDNLKFTYDIETNILMHLKKRTLYYTKVYIDPKLFEEPFYYKYSKENIGYSIPSREFARMFLNQRNAKWRKNKMHCFANGLYYNHLKYIEKYKEVSKVIENFIFGKEGISSISIGYDNLLSLSPYTSYNRICYNMKDIIERYHVN